MRITFQTEGGFAHFPGLNKPLTLDTSALPERDAAGLSDLVARADFFARAAQVGAGEGKADYRTYNITVEDAGRSHSVRVVEPVEDPHLQALIDGLRSRQRAPA